MKLLKKAEKATEATRAMEEANSVLETRNEELTNFNKLAVDRELRFVELKQMINEYAERLGEKPPYKLEEE